MKYTACIRQHFVYVRELEEDEQHNGVTVPKGWIAVTQRTGNEFTCFMPDKVQLDTFINSHQDKYNSLQDEVTKLLQDNIIEHKGVTYSYYDHNKPKAHSVKEMRDAGVPKDKIATWNDLYQKYGKLRINLNKRVSDGNETAIFTRFTSVKQVDYIVHLAARYHSATEIVDILKKTYPEEATLTSTKVAKIMTLNIGRIEKGREEYDQNRTEIRLTHKKSRIEELVDIYQSRKQMYNSLLKGYNDSMAVFNKRIKLYEGIIENIRLMDDDAVLDKFGAVLGGREKKPEAARRKLITHYSGEMGKKMKLHDLKLKQAQIHLDNSHTALRQTLEQIRKEEEGDVININAMRVTDLESAVNLQIRKEANRGLGLGMLVLGRACASAKIDPTAFMKDLVASTYRGVLNNEEDVQMHPSDYVYDWAAITEGQAEFQIEEEDDEGVNISLADTL